MPRGKIFITVLLGLLAAGFLAGGLVGAGRQPVDYAMAPDLPPPTPQAFGGRILRPAELELLLDLRSLEQPVAAAFGESGTLLVQDWPTKAVHELSREGRILASHAFSPPGASGPLTIQDFALDARDGRLWLVFQDASIVAALPRRGGVAKRVDLTAPALRVASVPGGVVSMSSEPSDPLFAFHGDGAQPRRFGRLVAADVPLRALSDGRLVGDGGPAFVYAPRYFSLLASFGADGELRYLVETVEPDPPPAMVGEGSRSVLEPGTRARTLSVDVDDEHVYLLSQREAAGGPRFLDVYRRADGAYLHSLRVPGRSIAARVQGDDLLLLEPGRVKLFQVEPADG